MAWFVHTLVYGSVSLNSKYYCIYALESASQKGLSLAGMKESSDVVLKHV
jgi:hypothetical protein